MLKATKMKALAAVFLLGVCLSYAPATRAAPGSTCTSVASNGAASASQHGREVLVLIDVTNDSTSSTCGDDDPLDERVGSTTDLTPEQLAAMLAIWLNSTYNSGMPTCQSLDRKSVV
mgnify:CR=1 FL=1